MAVQDARVHRHSHLIQLTARGLFCFASHLANKPAGYR